MCLDSVSDKLALKQLLRLGTRLMWVSPNKK